MQWHISTWGWTALYRRFKWLLFRREPEVGGQCRCCGRCCKEIVLHVAGKWLRTERQFEKCKLRDPDLERFRILDKDDDGRLVFSCSWLTEEGICRDYENRLDLCRSHPPLSLYYSGVVLPMYCGYTLKGPGFLELFQKFFPGRVPEQFSAVLKKEQASATEYDEHGVYKDLD